MGFCTQLVSQPLFQGAAVRSKMRPQERTPAAGDKIEKMPSQQNTLFDAEPEPWELDATQEVLAASVVFAEQPYGPYDYAVPASMAAKLKAGQRVQVPLGRGNRAIVGYCIGVGSKAV